MKNLLILFCSLLMSGVFGDTENVSVKEGDSVTLQINPEETKGATELVWRLNNTVIAKIDLEGKDKPPPVYTDEKRFRDRLNLERQTGSLTITNITAEHSGEYQMEIRSSGEIKHKTFRVSVSVSVKEGDSVTLQTGVTDGKDVKWKFNGANLTDSRFTNSEVNEQTGDLNISNIGLDQSGEYQVNINGRLHRIFRISISGEENMSVMEGDPVTLHTNATRIQAEDVIQWTFKDSLIAYSNKTTTTGRFDMNLAGSLIILKIRSDDSGLYDVNITGSKHIHKRFNVIVTGEYPEYLYI
ncbi:hypothetical protein IRJ41_000686 [Triplophysa rosa]|uniref:Immunoglobulin domain-containing protein n=1 Tax=Triplophysa rosa TaxID=992332 RepID=A0A9W7W967_TRIRA|nr:hypothetical protein IRJ41_000686 [Triplophysa rosa]